MNKKMKINHFNPDQNIEVIEVGISYGLNMIAFLTDNPNITKYYAIDPYIAYQDWVGPVTQEELNQWKKIAFDKVKDHGFLNKVEFIYERSEDALKYFKYNSIDYIYIDGDHSYDGAYFDISSYYDILKNNNIFAGHDIQIPGVKNALNDFLKLKNMDINKDLIETNFPQECSWYFHKNEN